MPKREATKRPEPYSTLRALAAPVELAVEAEPEAVVEPVAEAPVVEAEPLAAPELEAAAEEVDEATRLEAVMLAHVM